MASQGRIIKLVTDIEITIVDGHLKYEVRYETFRHAFGKFLPHEEEKNETIIEEITHANTTDSTLSEASGNGGTENPTGGSNRKSVGEVCDPTSGPRADHQDDNGGTVASHTDDDATEHDYPSRLLAATFNTTKGRRR